MQIKQTPLVGRWKVDQLITLRVTTKEDAGTFYPYGEKRIHFHVIGPGKIRALDNGIPIDVEAHFRVKHRIGFYGLTRAYLESTGQVGDISLLASCILGEKRQVTSNQVSIDSQFLSLRGELPPPDRKIFSTVDGSNPTTQSLRYLEAFNVPLDTTVKALVVLDGKPVQIMEERFAADEGFVVRGTQTGSSLGGDQAEDATLGGAKVISDSENFHGKGFVDFGQN